MKSLQMHDLYQGQNEFLNKKIIITGASSGIGLSASLFFLNCGAKVIMGGRDIETMKKICQENKFFNAIIMKLELKEDISLYDFKSSVIERFKTIDILVNCAGVKMDGDLENTFPQDFDYSININLRSIFYLINHFSPFMEKNSSIINLSCLYGTNPMAGMISHNVSKSGVEALTRFAAAELSAFSIRVNAITACPVDTNSMRLMHVDESEIEKFKKKMEKNIPLGRIARPDDIVKVISFLASERSKNITGQIIRVDGGRGLTSSGYVHYKGMLNMNSKFEPDGEKKEMKNLYGLGNLLNIKFEKKEEIPKDEKGLKKFINNKIKESNFSTNLSDAFLRNNPSYKIVEDNDQRLIDKYCNKEYPNPKYYEKKAKMKNYKSGSVNMAIPNNTFIQNSNLFNPSKSQNINQNSNIYFNRSGEPKDGKPKYQ